MDYAHSIRAININININADKPPKALFQRGASSIEIEFSDDRKERPRFEIESNGLTKSPAVQTTIWNSA
jgi:hypothetical protein